MSEIDKRVSEILKEFHPNPNDAVWLHKQSGQWIAKHKDLEIVAAKAGIMFDQPQIIEADARNGIAVVCVTGKYADRVEWSFGEATPKNTVQNYPFAMAEKRAKDRVILKLLGLHGFVYSDQETDEFKTADEKQRTPTFSECKQWLEDAYDMESLKYAWKDTSSAGFAEQLKEYKDERKEEIANGISK